MHVAEEVEVKFEYEAQQPDELTLYFGNVIRNCKPVEDGWMEGELNGKRGIFPDNFVSNALYSCMYICIYACMYVCMYCMYICTYVRA